MVSVVDRGVAEQELQRCRTLLWGEQDCAMPLDRFLSNYQLQYGSAPNMTLLTSDLENIVTVISDVKHALNPLSPLFVGYKGVVCCLFHPGP